MSFLDNLVLTKDVNGLVSYTKVRDLDPKTDKIYDVKAGEFIDFVIRESTKEAKTLVHIKQNGLGHNKPISDIWLHVGLNVEYRRNKIRASKLYPMLWESVRTHENIYAICTANGEAIDIAGAQVWSWRDASWLRIEGKSS